MKIQKIITNMDGHDSADFEICQQSISVLKDSTILNDKSGEMNDENNELIDLSLIEKEKIPEKLACKAALKSKDSRLIYDKMGESLISRNILTKYDEDEWLGLKQGFMINLNDGSNKMEM